MEPADNVAFHSRVCEQFVALADARDRRHFHSDATGLAAGMRLALLPATSEQLIYTQPYGIVLADASTPCITTQWHAFANATEFIALQGFALEYYETHSSPARPWGWVGDVQKMGAIPAQAQAWLIAEFNPRATAAGLREVSVVAETVFGQLATQRYIDETRLHQSHAALHTQLYNSLASARQGARQALAAR